MYDIVNKTTGWKMAEHYLSIPKEELETIEEENQNGEQCRIALLTTWHEYHGKESTNLTLITVLHKLRRYDLVDTL